MHAILRYDSITAVRRQNALRNLKKSICLHDYREVFSQSGNQLYVYRATPMIIFASPQLLSIINLFALKRLGQLGMEISAANDILDGLIQKQLGDSGNEDLLKIIPQRLGDPACEAKFVELFRAV